MKRVAIACWPDIRLERPVHEINEMFAVHIARAGAVPFLVPILDRGADLTPYVEQMDGLLLMGGADVSSFLYDEDPHKESERFHFKRDASEIALFHAARKPKTRAGHLPRHASDQCRLRRNPASASAGLEHTGNPRGDYPRRFPFHRVRTTGGRMKELYPDGLIVNSFHHQGIRDVAEELTVTAETYDGLPKP